MNASPATPEPRAIQPSALYRVPEAARLVGYHPATLRAKLREGAILGKRRRGGNWRVLGSELLRLA